MCCFVGRRVGGAKGGRRAARISLLPLKAQATPYCGPSHVLFFSIRVLLLQRFGDET